MSLCPSAGRPARTSSTRFRMSIVSGRITSQEPPGQNRLPIPWKAAKTGGTEGIREKRAHRVDDHAGPQPSRYRAKVELRPVKETPAGESPSTRTPTSPMWSFASSAA